MKQSEIQVGTEYVLDPAIVDADYEFGIDNGYRRIYRNIPGPITAIVMAKGLSHPWTVGERKDAVEVEFTGAFREGVDKAIASGWELRTSETILARRVDEPLAARQQRDIDREAEQQARQDAEVQRLADRAQGIHQAYIGSLIEEAETEASRAAAKLKSELEHLIERAQKNLDTLEEGTTRDRDRRPFWGNNLAPVEETGSFPYIDDIFLEGAIRDVGQALTTYKGTRAVHARWQTAINAVEQGDD
jgi:hypothetical protein